MFENRKRRAEDNLWKIRCAQAEKALEDCAAAFEIIPVWALKRNQQWMPSAEALLLITQAKDSVRTYAETHWHSGSGV